MLKILLEGGGGGCGDGDNMDTLYVEETVVVSIEMTCDPSIVNKVTDLHHINFVLGLVE